MNENPGNYLTKSPTYKRTTIKSKKKHKRKQLIRATRYIFFWLLVLCVAVLVKKTFFSFPTSSVPETILYSSESSDILADANYSDYPASLLELAEKKPETIAFVNNYGNYLANLEDKSPISITKDYTPGEIPLFIQWDTRWGYEHYGDDFIAVNGCGPTALSMVAVGLTGNTELNPKAIADFSYEQGYLVEGRGSSWDLMTKGAETLGLTSEELPLNDDVIISRLTNGNPIIASMRPGDFTTSGHFIVLTGIAPNEKIIVNDSDSLIRSNQTWDLDTLTKQIKNLWAFSS